MSDSFPESSTAAVGRLATDDSSDSSPESSRWSFASPKLPLADKSSRPKLVPGLAPKPLNGQADAQIQLECGQEGKVLEA